jgi:hypothetical protein
MLQEYQRLDETALFRRSKTRQITYHTLSVSDLVASSTDACDGNVSSNVKIVSASSDEPDGRVGTLNDIVIASNCKSVQLWAERDELFAGEIQSFIGFARAAKM